MARRCGQHALEPGTVLGVYSIARDLGRAGMGGVYLGSDRPLDRVGSCVAFLWPAMRKTRHNHPKQHEGRMPEVQANQERRENRAEV
jgi:hypothetical protein